MADPATPVRLFSPPSTFTPALDASCSSVNTSLTGVRSPVSLESSIEYVSEQACVDRFMRDTCGCKTGPRQSPCSSLLSKETMEKCRQDNLELSRDELDLVVLGQIRAHRSVASSTAPSSSRQRSSYYIHEIPVCRNTFLFLHCISKKRLENLVSQYDNVGVMTRVHGNTKRLPFNTFGAETVTKVTTFITNYARAHALPLPGRVPGHRDKVLLLPSDVSKVFVYLKYKEACEKESVVAVGRSSFYTLWEQLLPHISVSTPSSDLCYTCQQNTQSIILSACLPEEEKSKRLESARVHLSRAKAEREFYSGQVEVAQQACSAALESKTTPRLAHCSFDFAQQIHYPFDAQQTGPEYFKTARKCGLFGVCDDGSGKLILYLIDEAENPGKGADCVISLLHHYLETHASGVRVLYLHADNCTGQNKNNAVMQYLMWRVLTGRHDSLELAFMIVGHTKFSPDRYFGMFKKLFRRSSVSSLIEIVTVAEKSTTSGQIIPQLIRDVDGTLLVKFYQWSVYLSKFFRNIPNILSYHRFSITSQRPGVVELRQFSDSEAMAFNIFKSGINKDSLSGLPDDTVISGLDPARQWYLYEQIRQHCKSTLAADMTCPKPSHPKPSKTKEAPSPSKQVDIDMPSPKKQRMCSVCKMPGHTKRTCSKNLS